MRHMAKMERLKAGNIECIRIGLNNAKLLLLLAVFLTGHYVLLPKSVDAAQIVSKSLNRHRFFAILSHLLRQSGIIKFRVRHSHRIIQH